MSRRLIQAPTQDQRRIFLRRSVSAVAAVAGWGAGLSAVFPAVAQTNIGTLHMLCSGPAGSIPDIVARRIAEQMTGRYAQRLTVENKPGAAGQIAVAALKAAPADGSTVLLRKVPSPLPIRICIRSWLTTQCLTCSRFHWPVR